jgi:checkpoint serine/threonine-protein kinase
MEENREWKFQIDTFGLLGTIHTMLFGDYMKIKKKVIDGIKINSIENSFKRYWQVDLWKNLFHTLLNVKNCNSNPSLSNLRKTFEDYFIKNPRKSKTLKSLLMKQNVNIYKSINNNNNNN